MLSRRLRSLVLALMVLLVAVAVSITSASAALACDDDNRSGCPPDGTVVITSDQTSQPTGGGSSGPSVPKTCHNTYRALTGTDVDRLYYLNAMGIEDTGQTLYMSMCPNEVPDGNGLYYNYYIAGEAEPPPDPTVIATRVSARIYLPEVQIQFGPDASEVAVNVPVWLAVADPGHPTDGETERGLTVTMTASVQSLSFDMGQPGTAPVTCTGLGSLPGTGSDLADPPCGFTFSKRSLPERTGGVGKWPVTVTVTWNLHWEASNGQTGDMTRTTDSGTAVYVGEYRTVIVTG